jgi:hypothetical protein
VAVGGAPSGGDSMFSAATSSFLKFCHCPVKFAFAPPRASSCSKSTSRRSFRGLLGRFVDAAQVVGKLRGQPLRAWMVAVRQLPLHVCASTMYAVPGQKRQQALRKCLRWEAFRALFLLLFVACSSATRSGRPCPPLDLRSCCMSPECPF